MLSSNDVARSAASSSEKNGREHELVQTLAAIGEPRVQPTQAASAQARPQAEQPVAIL